jgi:fucose 4-O-acetylase-like acetyltransferase
VFFYDNLRFILIFLVVLRHFLFRVHVSFPAVEGLYMLFLTFLMPLFIFITGFYAKSVYSKDGGFRIGRVCMFVLLYVLLSFLIFITDFIIRDGRAEWTPLEMINAAWYLWACAAWFALIPVLKRTPPVATVIVTVALSLGVGYFEQVYYFLSLSKIITFLPFFAVGYYMSRPQMTGFLALGARWRVLAWAVVAVFAFCVIMWHTEANFWMKRILEAKDPYVFAWRGRGPWELGALWRLCWYAGASAMCACAMLIVPRCRTLFTAFGSRTLQIYIWHSVIVRALVPAQFFLVLDSWGAGWGQLAMVGAATALTFLLSWKSLVEPMGLIERATKGLVIGGKANRSG